MSAERPAAFDAEGDVKDSKIVVTTDDTPQTPGTPLKSESVVEMGPEPLSKVSSDISPDVSPALAKKYLWRARLQFLANCYSLFLAGWNDGTTGPLLTRIQDVYNVRGICCTFQPLNFMYADDHSVVG